jgi:DNA-3-methyladenine glycosylase
VRRPPRPLPLSFYRRGTAEVARDLLGRELWRRLTDGTLLAGRIVETEAYFGPDDPASHARRRTPRSDVMYGPPGRAYVYFTYGMHHCLNVVCEEPEVAGAVLLRALEPLVGLEVMARLRGRTVYDTGGGVRPRLLCRGPARLARALEVDRRLNGAVLTGPELWIARGIGPVADADVARTPRVGVRLARSRRARFVLRGSPFLSR